MNRAMGFSSKLRRLTAPVFVMIRGELAIGRIFAPQTHMRVALSSGCFLGFSASSLFGAGRPFFVPWPAIRFAEHAEGR